MGIVTSNMRFWSLVQDVTSINIDDGAKETCQWLTHTSNTSLWGIFCHSFNIALAYTEAGGCTYVSPARLTNALLNLSLWVIAGKSRTLMPFDWRKECVILAVHVCTCAFYCCKIHSLPCLRCCINSIERLKNFVHIPTGREKSIQNE